VLVHGAWHGGWCWARVGALASAAGIDVRAVTLTGLGDPAHLICPEVDLRTHAEDVVAVVEAEELDRIVVVAHSFAGVLLGEVTERLGGRLRRLARPSLAGGQLRQHRRRRPGVGRPQVDRPPPRVAGRGERGRATDRPTARLHRLHRAAARHIRPVRGGILLRAAA
jgi:pimeloyl-ACP methyl ester carboxylesterase